MPNWTHYSLVEGDYKNFRIRRVNPEDYDRVCEVVARCFIRDEPTAKLLGYSDKFAEEFNLAIRMVLPDGLSFLAEDKDTGEIAALRVTFNHTKSMSFDHLNITTREVKLLLKLIDEVEDKSKIKEVYGVDEWAEFLAAATDERYRGSGLAGEFYSRSLKFLKAEGFKHALVVVTNPHTRAATKKRGFEEIARVDYDKFLDFDGTPVFDKNQLTPEHYALCTIKKID